MVKECPHSGDVQDVTPSALGCEDCLKTGGTWLHLRVCRSCGYIGCCDSSPSRHANEHVAESDHPIVSSLEPGEEWSYCYADDVGMIIREIKGRTRIPPSPMLSR